MIDNFMYFKNDYGCSLRKSDASGSKSDKRKNSAKFRRFLSFLEVIRKVAEVENLDLASRYYYKQHKKKKPTTPFHAR